jgi:hypothetical protein
MAMLGHTFRDPVRSPTDDPPQSLPLHVTCWLMTLVLARLTCRFPEPRPCRRKSYRIAVFSS